MPREPPVTMATRSWREKSSVTSGVYRVGTPSTPCVLERRCHTSAQVQAEQLQPAREYGRGALRSSLVARLTGLTVRQLQYWHVTGLQDAGVRKGRRGT